MSAVPINELSAASSSIAAISTNARIDYILRFNKQAVLVVGENDYSGIGSLFLGNLPAEYNACYVATSAKLNDIQIRCRIIEQLFTDVLFDPEQALAVSILRLAKGSKQPISIVIDHAHHLSFQLIHELTYLAQVAKKAKLVINVVMLGNYSAGCKIAQEKSLFANKIALVDASSGQLLKLDNKLFVTKKIPFLSTGQRKFILMFTVLVTLLILTLFLLSQNSLINLISTKTTVGARSDLNGVERPLGIKEPFVNLSVEKKLTKKLPQDNIASQADIYQALLQPRLSINTMAKEIAKPEDILAALEQVTTKILNNQGDAAIAKPDEFKSSTLIKANNSTSYGINPDYYLSHKQGYVIQIAGVVNQTAFTNAVDNLNLTEYYGYYRLLNNNKLIVLTSKIYRERVRADEVLAKLPENIRQQSPWIKPLVRVKKEITDFQKRLKRYN